MLHHLRKPRRPLVCQDEHPRFQRVRSSHITATLARRFWADGGADGAAVLIEDGRGGWDLVKTISGHARRDGIGGAVGDGGDDAVCVWGAGCRLSREAEVAGREAVAADPSGGARAGKPGDGRQAAKAGLRMGRDDARKLLSSLAIQGYGQFPESEESV